MIVRRTLPPTPRMFGRRGFPTSTGATLLYAALAPAASPRTGAAQRLGDYPFTLGIASGDPTADGVVLWTRLAPRPFDGGGLPSHPIAVQWQVSTDERMDRIVTRGAVLARPELGHSVHVEVDGLEPSRWYRFKVGNDVHQNFVRNVPPDSVRLDASPVATEHIGTSISSGGDRTLSTVLGGTANNPHLRFADNHLGYVRCAVGADLWRADYRGVSTIASFVVPQSQPGAQRV